MDADPSIDLIQDLHRTSGGTFIVNSGFSRMTSRDEAVTAVDENIADLVASVAPRPPTPASSPAGRRCRGNEVNRATVYGGGETGCIDYPFLQD